MKIIDALFYGGWGYIGKFMVWLLVTFILLCFPDQLPQVPVWIAGLVLATISWFYTYFKNKNDNTPGTNDAAFEKQK